MTLTVHLKVHQVCKHRVVIVVLGAVSASPWRLRGGAKLLPIVNFYVCAATVMCLLLGVLRSSYFYGDAFYSIVAAV